MCQGERGVLAFSGLNAKAEGGAGGTERIVHQLSQTGVGVQGAPVRGGRQVTFWRGWEDEPPCGLSSSRSRLLQ